MRIPRHFLMPLALAITFVAGRAYAAPGAVQSRPSFQGCRIVGAAIVSDAVSVVLAERPREGEAERFRFMRVREAGRILEEVGSTFDDSLHRFDLYHVAFLHKAELVLGWVESGKGVRIAVPKSGVIETRTLIADTEGDGTLGEFAVVDIAGQSRLVLMRNRYIRAEGGLDQIGRQYAWVYSYDLEKEDPKLLAKVCVENDVNRVAEMHFTSGTDGVVIWQVMYEKGSPVNTVRCATWRKERELSWTECYVGNDLLALFVHPDNGSASLVWEWKSPQEGSGVFSLLNLRGTEILPVDRGREECCAVTSMP